MLGIEKKKMEYIIGLVENWTQAVMVLYPDGSVMTCNNALYKLIAHDEDELAVVRKRADIQEFIHDAIKNINKTSAVPTDINIEYIDQNGRTLILNVSLQASYNYHGKADYYLVLVNDITERCLYEQALKKSEERYRFIVDNAYDGISILNPHDCSYIFVNSALIKCMGYTEREFLGKTALDFVHPDDLESVRQAIKKGVQAGKGEVQYRYLKKDASYVWLDVRGKVLEREGKTEWFFISRDVTQKKLAEDALKESEDRYRLIADNTGDTVALIDPETMQFLYASPSHLKLFDFDPEELLGRKAIDYVHPHDFEITIEALKKGMVDGEGTARYRTRKKDGSYVWLDVHGKLLRSEMGRPIIQLVCRNIDETKKAEEELRESKEKYRWIAENAYDLVSVIEPDTFKYQYLSPSHSRIVGFSVEELAGKSCMNNIHPEDRQYVMERLNKGMARGNGIAQYRSRKKDGSYIWLETIGRLISEAGEKPYVLLVARDISQRKETEEALKRSEEKYRLIAENVADMVSVIDSETGNFLYVSPSNLRIMGYSELETLNRNYMKGVLREDRAKVLASFKKCIAQGEGSIEYRARKKDGSYIWLESVGKIIEYSQGKKAMLTVSRDITERKMIEEALKNSEEQYRLIAENVADMVDVIDLQSYRIIYASPSQFREVIGFPAEKALGRNCSEFLNSENRDQMYQEFKKIIKNGKGSSRYRLKKTDGSCLWLEFNIKLIDYRGKAALLVVIRDINATVMAEQELQEQLEFQNSLIQNMNELLYTYDLKGNLSFINNKVCEVLGYDPDEILGKPIIELVPEREKALITKQMKRMSDSKEPNFLEHSILCKNGAEIIVRIKTSALIKDDRITGRMVLAEDITEKRKIEKEMARLAQLNIIGEMAAGMGHEIRNPMTTVKGYLQIMKQNEDLKEYWQIYETMLEELERANSIITEFLSLARNKLVDLQIKNLNQIINALFPLLQADALIFDKHIKLDLSEVPDLLLDEKEIRQLILNLVRNGLEAMLPSGTVIIKTFCKNNEVQLIVKDQGAGIKAEILDKVGTPFFTTKENGTGLGLAVCYGIVARHQAKIDIKTSSQGTVFTIEFKIPNTTQ